jgi:hypothetical protein
MKIELYHARGVPGRSSERREDQRLERVAGIEPASLAWKARALPLSNTRGRKQGLYCTIMRMNVKSDRMSTSVASATEKEASSMRVMFLKSQVARSCEEK